MSQSAGVHPKIVSRLSPFKISLKQRNCPNDPGSVISNETDKPVDAEADEIAVL